MNGPNRSADQLLNDGIALAKAGQLNEAINTFQLAVDTEPGRPEFHFNLAVALEHAGHFDLAEVEYKTAISFETDGYTSARWNFGILLSEQKRYSEAIQIWRQLVKLDPENADLFVRIGDAYMDLEQYAEASEEYRTAVSISPNYAFAHNKLGMSYANRGLDAKAVASYENAIEIDPIFIEAYVNLGISLDQIGMFEGARVAYESALRIAPNDADAYHNVAVSLAWQGRGREADSMYRKVIELGDGMETVALTYKNLAKHAEIDGHPYEAIAALRRSIEICPENAETYYDLGRIYSASGNKAEALVCFGKALELSTSDTLTTLLHRLIANMRLV